MFSRRTGGCEVVQGGSVPFFVDKAEKSVRLTRASMVADFWTGARLGRKDVVTIADMPAHAARLLECVDG